MPEIRARPASENAVFSASTAFNISPANAVCELEALATCSVAELTVSPKSPNLLFSVCGIWPEKSEMKKVCPIDDQNAMAIPNIRNRHSLPTKSQLLIGIGITDAESGRADGGGSARDFRETDFGFDAIPQFSTQNSI